jgi:hypothetical protein
VSEHDDLLRRLIIAWDSDQDEEFSEAMDEVRSAVGFVLTDDHDAVLARLQAKHVDDEDADTPEDEA